MQKIIFNSATEITRKIRDKELTSLEVTRQFLAQIKRFNFPINAISDIRPEVDILKEAEKKDQLEQLMEIEKPYLNSGLTLRDLAKKLGIPPNHLSQLLSEGFNKNFSEYVNSYRLEAFKSKAADSAQQHLTILALAYESGFNSKTVFNTFFKKVMGKTPKVYWKEVAK